MKKPKIKPMSEWDRLSIDAYNARQAGMSYGQWKALQKPEKVEPKIPEGWKECERCGRQFNTNRSDQRFCGFECQRVAYYEKRNKIKNKRIDIAGQRFGRLTVVDAVERPKDRKQGTYWLCKCDCGGTEIVRTDKLTQGRKRSCGCLMRRGEKWVNQESLA